MPLRGEKNRDASIAHGEKVSKRKTRKETKEGKKKEKETIPDVTFFR